MGGLREVPDPVVAAKERTLISRFVCVYLKSRYILPVVHSFYLAGVLDLSTQSLSRLRQRGAVLRSHSRTKNHFKLCNLQLHIYMYVVFKAMTR